MKQFGFRGNDDCLHIKDAFASLRAMRVLHTPTLSKTEEAAAMLEALLAYWYQRGETNRNPGAEALIPKVNLVMLLPLQIFDDRLHGGATDILGSGCAFLNVGVRHDDVTLKFVGRWGWLQEAGGHLHTPPLLTDTRTRCPWTQLFAEMLVLLQLLWPSVAPPAAETEPEASNTQCCCRKMSRGAEKLKLNVDLAEICTPGLLIWFNRLCVPQRFHQVTVDLLR